MESMKVDSLNEQDYIEITPMDKKILIHVISNSEAQVMISITQAQKLTAILLGFLSVNTK